MQNMSNKCEAIYTFNYIANLKNKVMPFIKFSFKCSRNSTGSMWGGWL